MRFVRAAAILGAVLLIGGGLLMALLPIEDGTCAQLYEDFYGPSHDAALIRNTPWDCLAAIQSVNRRLADEEAREKAQRTQAAAQNAIENQRREAAVRLAAQQQEEADKREALRRAKLMAHTEDEAALVALLREAMCPRVGQTTGKDAVSLSLLHAKGETILFQVDTSCEDCRYAQPPTSTWNRPDGAVFCTAGGQAGGDCPQKLAMLEVLTRAQRSGTGAEMREWLGCSSVANHPSTK